MNEFEQLLAELDTLAKAGPVGNDEGGDDKRIQQAADDSEHAEPDGDEDGEYDDGDEDNEDEDEDEDETLGKSLSVTLPDGTKAEAYDGTMLVKSLIERHDQHRDLMLKSLQGAVLAITRLNKTVERLQGQVAKLSKSGSGRRSTLVLRDKEIDGHLAKAMPEQSDIMTKANSAFSDGRISAVQLNTLDIAHRRGQLAQVDHNLLAKL